MCGICGVFNFNQKPAEKELLRKMCKSLSCRGPDDQGFYIRQISPGKNNVSVGLGHQRLSVIDLSHAGHQPMCNEDRTLWITYNGEIYNFRKLRDNLKKNGHDFKSDSDTEVILHLYEEQGSGAVRHLNGMFAFALWDENNSRLWLCRDRIGIKPLVYYWDGECLAFASEIKALLCNPSVPRELDTEALQLYLTLSYIPAPYTIFRGIQKLEPGHSLILENGKLKIEKYWDIPREADPDFSSFFSSLPFSEQVKVCKDRLSACLSDAVRKRMIADVPLGAFLSGGIDSSIIVALMSGYSSGPVKTFSIGFTDADLFDETRYAREVANLYKTDHHEFRLTHRDMTDILQDVLPVFDEPFSDSSAIPTFIVSRETRRHVTVALSGDGGDELFAGYRSYLGQHWFEKYMMIPALFREKILERFVRSLPDSRESRILEYIRRAKKFIKSTKGTFPEQVLSLKEVFPGDIRQGIVSKYLAGNPGNENIALELIRRNLDRYPNDRLNSILYTDIKNSLPGDMLTKVDWMSMRNSLEVRVPFLDHRVVELAFSIPGYLKISRGKTKYILRETFRDILPKSLHNRPKAGFEIPLGTWLRKDLKFLVDTYLGTGKIIKQGIFDPEITGSLIRDHMTGRTDTSWMLWNLIVFQYWYENYRFPDN